MSYFKSLSDEQLQKLASGGDRRAEDELAQRYVRLVRVCARPYFLAGGDSEDLTQEGMLGLLSAIREYDEKAGSPFRAFAEVCIRRRIYSAIKSASRLKHTPLNDGISLEAAFGEEHTTERPYPAVDFRRVPEEQVLARESANEFLNTFSRCLSPLEKNILPLFLDGLSYRAIAQSCGKDEKAVDNAVQRIRRKLARETISGDISES